MSVKAVIEKVIAVAERGGMVGAHFGIVCSSWSVLNRLNCGTTTRQQPHGNGTLRMELLGNEQTRLMFCLTREFDRLGIPYTVENPESSALWWLSQWDKIPFAVFD